MTVSIQKLKAAENFPKEVPFWKRAFGLTSRHKEKSEIAVLQRKLLQLQSVSQVKTSVSPENPHEITFQIFSNCDSFHEKRITEEAMRLVIETEWRLDDISENDDWDFSVQIFRESNCNLSNF